MFIAFRKSKPALFFLQLSVWTIIYLTGCGGNENIPPASILASGKVTLTWKDVPGAAVYNVYLSTSPNVTFLNSYKISNATSPLTITDLNPGSTYYFVITVEDDSGQIWKSKEMSYTIENTEGTIQLDDILIPSKPKTAVADKEPMVNASTPETRDVTIAWDDVPNATSYNIYWSTRPGVTKKNGTKISNVKNPHKIPGLKTGIRYYFVVTAVNASGESKESEEISFIFGK